MINWMVKITERSRTHESTHTVVYILTGLWNRGGFIAFHYRPEIFATVVWVIRVCVSSRRPTPTENWYPHFSAARLRLGLLTPHTLRIELVQA